VNEGHEDPPKLPLRKQSSRPGTGRHRRPLPADLPSDAPVLVLAVPGKAGDSVEVDGAVAIEVASIVQVDNPQIDLRLVSLADGGADLAKEFSAIATDHQAEGPAAVVVPLVTGPHPRVLRAVRDAVTQSEAVVKVTEPLGPHPLLAEALHVRLSEAGLARADRMRLFNVTSPVDGIIVATAGGDEAARGADATAVLLAARLTLPVGPAALDGVPTVRDAAERLRKIGANRLAVAPYIIGPEADGDRVTAAAESIEAGCSAPLGAHEAVARMVCVRYGAALGGLPDFDDLAE
jgi:sirohydrochlorin ferrochelatase